MGVSAGMPHCHFLYLCDWIGSDTPQHLVLATEVSGSYHCSPWQLLVVTIAASGSYHCNIYTHCICSGAAGSSVLHIRVVTIAVSLSGTGFIYTSLPAQFPE